MRRGFTLLELLMVISIIAILTAAGMGGYLGVIRAAQRSRGTELVHNFQVALEMALQKLDSWPPVIVRASQGDGQATCDVGVCLGRPVDKGGLGVFSFGSCVPKGDETVYAVDDVEKFGVLSPWGTDVARRRIGTKLSDDTVLPTGGTIADHRLRFAVDDDYDGITEVRYTGGAAVSVRANACVWSCGYDGKFGTKDDIKSWAKGQEIRK